MVGVIKTLALFAFLAAVDASSEVTEAPTLQAALIQATPPGVIQAVDNRCYLENGGSAESFFVNEDLPVGSFIGSLRIVGDPGEYGNIALHLKEADSPISIAPFAKNLSLTRQLDKEGINGPASVFVNIICERRRTLDPSFIIPVNIRVTDANDNAPIFINAPYLLNASEVTVIGTRVIQGIRATDVDQHGPFSTVQYSVLPGRYADYFSFVNGLEGTLVLRKSLDYETLPNFTISIRAQDQGNPPKNSDTIVYVNVIDADDQNPKFSEDGYFAILPDKVTQGVKLKITPREITAFDQDSGIRSPLYYSFNSEGSDYRYFDINKDGGGVYTKKSIPEDDFLQPVTLVIKATQYDNSDRYALTTLTVSKSGVSQREPLQFLHNHYFAAILENAPVNSVLLTIITNKPRNKRLKYWLSAYTDTFNASSNGDIILRKPLDYETMDSYTFSILATDSYINTSALVNITVLNVNDWDPRFRYPQYEFYIPDGPLIGASIGKVEAADGDRGDRISLSLRGPESQMFSINDVGEISAPDLSKANGSTFHLVAVATDSGTPPRQASVPVIVHLPPTGGVNASQWVPQGANFAIMAIFSVVFVLLAFIIVVLVVYIQKNKKQKNSSRTKGLFTGADKSLTPYGNIENPVFNGSSNFQTRSPPASPIYTATVKSTSSKNGFAKNGVTVCPTRGRHKIAPAPPQVPAGSHINIADSDSSRTASPCGNTNEAKNSSWLVSGSIPRRVKKLSWDDEIHRFNKEPRMDPDVSVTPLVMDANNADHMNLTVYF